MLSIPLSRHYDWDLTAEGRPDMRKAKNRQNVCDMAARLQSSLEETQRANKVLKAKEEIKDDSTCAICMDEMEGVAILKCGHSMCPACFAQHARLSHTCPFCRDEFAPKPKKPRAAMPEQVQNAIAEHWVTHHSTEGYFERFETAVAASETSADKQLLLEWLVRENSKILMKRVVKWYAETDDVD